MKQIQIRCEDHEKRRVEILANTAGESQNQYCLNQILAPKEDDSWFATVEWLDTCATFSRLSMCYSALVPLDIECADGEVIEIKVFVTKPVKQFPGDPDEFTVSLIQANPDAEDGDEDLITLTCWPPTPTRKHFRDLFKTFGAELKENGSCEY